MATELADLHQSPSFIGGAAPQDLIAQESGNIAKNIPQVSSLYKFLQVLKDIGRPVRTFRRQPTTTTTTAQTELDTIDPHVEASSELADRQPNVPDPPAPTNQSTRIQRVDANSELADGQSIVTDPQSSAFQEANRTVPGRSNLSPGKTIAPSLRRGVVPFEGIGKNLYEATLLRPEAALLNDWKTSWKPTLEKRLKDLRLGQPVTTNIRLSMVGESADAKSMKPTILVICAEAKLKDVENGLTDFIRISIPSKVDFKVTTGRVKLTAGEASDLPVSRVGERTGLLVKLRDDLEILSLMGVVVIVQSTEHKTAFFPACTLGGVVLIGGTFYALTVAHSIFRTATGTDRSYTAPKLRTCGLIESYEWSGNENLQTFPAPYFTQRTAAADWMLIRLRQEFVLPNLFKIPDSDSPQEVTGYFRNPELPDDIVWVCGGITGTQFGILNTTPSSILFGQVSYDVLSIALEFPLGI